MEELKKLNSEAYHWLNSIPPKHWSISHFLEIDKANGPLTPTATKTLQKKRQYSVGQCSVIMGSTRLQVKCVVKMEQQTCSCNRWELIGIPCKHSIAAIWDIRLNNENVGIPKTWVHPTYWLKTWKEMYVFKVEPIMGDFCGKKAHRRRSATEDDGVSIKWKFVTCTKCGNVARSVT
uniref:SWIM-type domain-containing protein n=1 Tax=Lactuca sativa TaxID=4236 RepID=A0A9R1UTK8_LACSA|nr:hypothetical protein LSAT_V11C800390380 [Lactuca sativa]